MEFLTPFIRSFGSQPEQYSTVSYANLKKSRRASDEETLDGQHEADVLLEDSKPYLPFTLLHHFRVITTTAAVCLFILAMAGAFLLGRSWPLHLDEKCMRHGSTYSTVMDQVSNKLEHVRFNGTLGKNSDFSGHWGDPNEAMDRNWHKWGFVKYASFTTEEFAAMGMDLEGSAKFTEEYGGGYIGFLEISHQMHCLNVIRQAYHWDYYEKPENRKWASWMDDRPITVKVHINHCFEMFRQLIMCNSDLGVIPHHWVKDIQDPYANFNTVHKCRDLDSVAEWIEEHVVPPAPETGYPMPAGSKVWPTPP